MTALSAERNTPIRNFEFADGPCAANVTCYAGGIACRDASGNVTPGATATTLVAVGIFEETKVNGAVAGANRVKYRRGVGRFANSSSGDLIAATEIGKIVYIVDDQTVAKTNGTNTRSKAGVCVDVDAAGVWVAIGADITGAI